MTNSEARRAAAALVTALDLLAAERMSRAVDERIDRAATSFTVEEIPGPSAGDFKTIIREFTRHLYAYGLRLPQRPTDAQALAEAVHILELIYNDPRTGGYEAALLEADGRGGEGVAQVLGRIAEAVKATERRAYVGWVIARWLAPRGWTARCEIARLLVERLGESLPDGVRQCAPARLVGEIPELVLMHVGTDEELLGLRTAPSFR